MPLARAATFTAFAEAAHALQVPNGEGSLFLLACKSKWVIMIGMHPSGKQGAENV
jgi:hypothetical protein